MQASKINHKAKENLKTQVALWLLVDKSSGATALQSLDRQSGRRRSAELVPTFAERGVSRGQRNGSPWQLISVYRTWIATYFIQVAPQLTSRSWVYPVPDPLRKSGSAGNRTRDLCICSQKLWPLDHRGGLFVYLQLSSQVQAGDGSKKSKNVAASCNFKKIFLKSCVRLYFTVLFN